jgi:hypothetical protein
VVKRLLAAACLAVLASSGPALAQPAGFLVEASWFQTSPKGSFQLMGSNPAVPGTTTSFTTIDPEADLGLGKKSLFPLGFRIIRAGYRLEGEYLAPGSTFAGDSVAPRAFAFQSATFLPGEAIHSEVKVQDWSAHLRYDIWSSPYTSLGAGIDVDYFRFEATVASLTTPGSFASDRKNVTIPTATIALNFHDAASHLFVDGKYSYMSYSGTKCMKLRAEIGYAIVEGLGIKGGWRSTRVEYVKANGSFPEERFDIKLEGFYAGAFVNF